MAVQSFDTLAEMFKAMRAMEDEANKHLPQAPPVKYGDHVLRVMDGLVIYGTLVDPMDYWRELEAKGALDEESLSEKEYEREHAVSKEKRGYWFGRWYSVMCVQGELGDTHATQFTSVISSEAFEKAKKLGWPCGGPGLEAVLAAASLGSG